MKYRILIHLVCIIIAILLQTTLTGFMEIYGVKPNLVLIFVVCSALLRGSVEGSILGFATGFILDILFGRLLGFYALLGFYLGMAAGVVNKRLYRENYLVAISLTFVSTIIYEGLVYVLNAFMKGNVELLVPLINAILIEAAYNSGIALLIFTVVIRINRKFEKLAKAERKY